MISAYEELVSRAGDWFERALAAEWLDESDRRRIAALERATPADLFADQSRDPDQSRDREGAEAHLRPLVIALFGGTGVGKSSLLNRLAGSVIARVGAERPTSRDVTLYVHESVRLAELPAELPLEHVRVRPHSSPAHRDVLWIDAPDIDSTEEANRRCSLAWLPHVDLLCYVVSPERYRDDAGWRVLRERGGRHGWMFVMNRWDEGDPRQREDFLEMLRAAGFDDPLLLCTCCSEARPAQRPAATRVGPVCNRSIRPPRGAAATFALPSPDEFERIQATIREVLDAHAVRELTRLGHRARLQELRGVIEELQGRFGDGAGWDRIDAALSRRWQRVRAQLREGAEWPMRTVAARFAVRESGVVRRVGQQLIGLSGGQPDENPTNGGTPNVGELDALTESLWDDWSQSRVGGCLDAVEIAAGRAGLATRPLRRQMDEVAGDARGIVLEPVQDEVRLALLRPGTFAVRVARRITGFLLYALPILALGAVGCQVAVSYYRATTGSAGFLGTDFAAHSGLLVLVAWALPFLLHRALCPSLEKAVLRALRRGFGSGLDVLAARLEHAGSVAAEEAHRYRQEARGLLDEVGEMTTRPLDLHSRPLARLVAAG